MENNFIFESDDSNFKKIVNEISSSDKNFTFYSCLKSITQQYQLQQNYLNECLDLLKSADDKKYIHIKWKLLDHEVQLEHAFEKDYESFIKNFTICIRKFFINENCSIYFKNQNEQNILQEIFNFNKELQKLIEIFKSAILTPKEFKDAIYNQTSNNFFKQTLRKF